LTSRVAPFVPAVRIQDSLLAPIERRALLWFAARMPAWINSDHLTLFGFAAMILAGFSYALAAWDPRMLLVGIACLAANWFGDSLDGTLARFRQRQRPRYGYYVDHAADAFGAVFLFGGMGLSPYMTREIALVLIAAYFLICIEIYLATHTTGEFRISFGIFGPTELRIVLAIGNLAVLAKPRVTLGGQSYLLFDVGAVVAAVGMTCAAIVSAIRNTARLYREERLP
jgi:phosphatidylglycerophosphate synthase